MKRQMSPMRHVGIGVNVPIDQFLSMPIGQIKLTREHPEYAGRQSVEISDDYDCILVATHHDEYKDFDFSGFKAPLVDTRSCVTKRPERYYKA